MNVTTPKMAQENLCPCTFEPGQESRVGPSQVPSIQEEDSYTFLAPSSDAMGNNEWSCVTVSRFSLALLCKEKHPEPRASQISPSTSLALKAEQPQDICLQCLWQIGLIKPSDGQAPIEV